MEGPEQRIRIYYSVSSFGVVIGLPFLHTARFVLGSFFDGLPFVPIEMD